MKYTLLTILRIIALTILFTILLSLSSALTTPPEISQMMTQEQINHSTSMLPLVSLIMTAMLAYLTPRSRWHGWKLAAALFAIFFGLYAFLGWIELLAFPAVSNNMPSGMLTGMLVTGLIIGILFALSAILILQKMRPDPGGADLPPRPHVLASEWVWKLATGAILYLIVYFTFGYYVAWRTPGLPKFYGGTDPGTFLGQLANVARDTPWLFALQIFRGLIWTGLGCLITRMHKGQAWEVILATGLTFTAIMNASLLIPNPFMPPFVAHAHAIELVTSNLLYGILLAALMLWTPNKRLGLTRAALPAN